MHLLLAATALVTLCGCTHNDGDIGLWFGLWHLDTIEVDGTPASDYDGNTYFMFQGKVFCVRNVKESTHTYDESYARWQQSDDRQAMTITFADDRFVPTVTAAVPLERVTTFTVISLTSSEMVLEYTHSQTGVTRTCHFTHWE